MDNINQILSQINLQELIKVFRFQIALAIFLIFLIFRGTFSKIVLKIFYVLTQNKSKEKIKDTKSYKVLSNFFIFVGLYISARTFELSNQAFANINTIFRVICILFGTNFINSFITKDSKIFRKYIGKSKNDVVNSFICKIVKTIIWIISGYIIIKEEFKFDLTGLVAGFGIGSVIISLAAQDTVKSLLSGAVILTDKPFDIGDYIEVGNYKGTVVDITYRSTRIKALDNSIITIPNSIITDEYVVNWNRLKTRRIEFVLNLSLDTTSDKIKDIIEKTRLVLKNTPEVLPETVQVNLDALSSYSSDIRIFLYINESDYIKSLNIKEKIYCDILELVERENIDLAYPTQTVYVKNDVTQETMKSEIEEG